jgi:hypothetical protein
LPEPDGELLVSQRVERPQSDPYERRIERDGTVLELSSVRAHVEEGRMRFETIPLEWRELARLPPEAVARIEDAIRREGVLELPAEQAPEGTSVGGSIVTITAALDGREHTVRLTNLVPAQVPGLAKLDETMQVAVGEALHPG